METEAMRLFKRKSIDEKFADIGFEKISENDVKIEYRKVDKYETEYLTIGIDSVLCKCFIHKFIYDHNNRSGIMYPSYLLFYEKYLCKRKARQRGWTLK